MVFGAIFLFISVLQVEAVKMFRVDNPRIDAVVIPGDTASSCPQREARQAAIEKLTKVIEKRIAFTVRECGDGMWNQIATLDMNDLQQQCPSGWREYNESSVRACGRPVTTSSSCAKVSYTIGRQYTKVCGRVIGYQVTSPDGFLSSGTIDQNYVDGVSITYGENPRQHIWTYAAGVTENSTDHDLNNCPCWNDRAQQPPEFVGKNYSCESANPSDSVGPGSYLYSEDKLWDGEQCSNEGSCCSVQSPPWFNVKLLNPTSDDIEIRICGDESTNNEDTPIELLEIYIQ